MAIIYTYFVLGVIANRILVSPLTKWTARVERSEGDFRLVFFLSLFSCVFRDCFVSVVLLMFLKEGGGAGGVKGGWENAGIFLIDTKCRIHAVSSNCLFV